MSGLAKLNNHIDRILTFFEEWTLFIAVMGALISLFANVVLRYGFKYSLAWSEELVRLVIIYTTLIGCSAAVKNRTMIKIDASTSDQPCASFGVNKHLGQDFVDLYNEGEMIFAASKCMC